MAAVSKPKFNTAGPATGMSHVIDKMAGRSHAPMRPQRKIHE